LSEEVELGGNITLAGFKEVSHAEMVVVKKMVGSYARQLASDLTDFKSLKVTLKNVHKVEDSKKYELHVSVRYRGEHFEVKEVDRNLFVGLDSVLHKATEHAMKEEEKMNDK
jgi:ribosome-associated translation inhibitor RaiA